ncbi:MAG: peptide/nickel transport system ATP-binding protein, partial [Saprospiraceae bacterium]
YDTVLHAISFSLRKSEILGIVGESGSGKTTIAKAIVGMIKPTKGEINYYTADHKLVRLGIKPRRDIQLIFQDPYSALNPSMFIGKSLYELISFHGLYSKSEIDNRISILLNQVGLSNDYYDRLPQALSGGQRQRVCIAKALALEPRILICDECVSALDVTVQAQILELLLKIRDELDLSLLFISHDLAVINIICDRVIVISSGEIVESGSPQDIIHNPQNTYTKELIKSIPGFQAN